MRTSTKTAVGVITLGVLGLSYQLGESAEINTGQFAAPAPSDSSVPSASSSPVASASSTSAPAPIASNSATIAPAPKPSASASTAPAPKPSASQSQTSSGASGTKSGSVIESGFGTVQVQVTMVSGTISDITMLQANATHGRAAAFSFLVQYAIEANGANFANMSGATYTTNAFKQSLRDALAKF